MSDFKIRPPATPSNDSVRGTEQKGETGRTFELNQGGPAETTPVGGAVTEPKALVQQLRTGEIDLEQAVDVLIEQALRAQPLAAGSESMRRDIRLALTELVNEDPTLSALASAMKR